MIFIVQIICNIIAVITGIFAGILFFIGFVDDADMYVPAFVWLLIMVGAISCSYLLSTV